ncbi:MAG: protein kinase, partial [Planctomycetota bacterium]
RAAAAIKHPNIITIHSVSARPPFPFIVMEYVEGATLQQHLDRDGVFSPQETARVGLQVAKALHRAHSAQVVHRDIKPANILIESGTRLAKVTDFGLARFADDSQLTRTGIIVGTPAFLAPETLDEELPYDGRGDLFSLGSVLYALCSGGSPFDSDSLLKTLRNIERKQPTPIRNRNSDVPEWLAQIIAKLLQKDPRQRFQSAGQVAQALQVGLSERPSIAPVIQAKKSRPNTKSTRKKQPVSLVVSMVATLLVLVTGAALLTWMQRSGDPPETISSAPGELAKPPRHGGFGGGLGGGRLGDGSVDGQPFVDGDALPFVVRGGFQSESFETLEEAVEAAESGDRIEIRTNDTIEIEQGFIELDSLTIAAADGLDPTIRFVGRFDEEEDENALLIVEGDLTLRGLTLVTDVDEPHDETWTLLRIDGGNLVASGCRFRARKANCLQLLDSRNVDLRDCEFHSSEETGIEFIANRESKIRLQNCMISARVGLSGELEVGPELSLQHCTLIASEALAFEINEEQMSINQQLRLSVNHSLLVTQDGAYDLTGLGEDAAKKDGWITWAGQGNVYSGPILTDTEDRFLSGNAEWRQLSGESPITRVAKPFQVDNEELWLRREEDDFRLSELRLNTELKPDERNALINAGASPRVQL